MSPAQGRVSGKAVTDGGSGQGGQQAQMTGWLCSRGQRRLDGVSGNLSVSSTNGVGDCP